MFSDIDTVSLLSLASRAVDGHIIDELARRGHPDLRAKYGYVFQRLLASPQSISTLAEDLHVTQQAMSKTVAELRTRGYVTIGPDHTDARRRLVALTERASDAIDQAREIRVGIEAAMVRRAGERTLNDFRASLTGILGDLGLSDHIQARTVPIPSGSEVQPASPPQTPSA